ncbi:glucan biosynthesis protein [Salinisphaera sp. Q1T1-3]|uniref:glucan biosynthesis protein n=1 Tax=Salinisphaera sp. Q1T1-3 TaxID=2321229 RepID=UPI000E735517|nr:glucan biosynthesis protein [Salinisphaera sp. Q1T1-3]RJS94343.1 glucans biosynthesis protein [Salinisphaera sp. Q1T1-3]
MMPTRRRLLLSCAAWAGAGFLSSLVASPRAFATDAGAPWADGQPFSFEALVALARRQAAQPYTAPPAPDSKQLAALNYDTSRRIRTTDAGRRWQNAESPFTLELLPVDAGADTPVEINLVEDGIVRRLPYDPAAFTLPDSDGGTALPNDLGYAGFRLRDRRTDDHEWLAFKGASYFRSPGSRDQYGLSARGLAVDTGLADQESFPAFTRFWIEKPALNDTHITIHALLDGPTVTGAYRMRCTHPGDVVMDIETRLFQRADIARLGIAPLTSMFWFSETNGRFGQDWRPEVHDSDGLVIETRDGERLWRALNNPPRPDTSLFQTPSPRGFGLLQRDRRAAHYLDPAVAFERRPDAWITPRGDWGDGQIALYEWPTNVEYSDNVNAFWIPQVAARAGRHWAFDYRLTWTTSPTFARHLARVVATRTGRIGVPGKPGYVPQNREFVIDFTGGPVNGDKPDKHVSLEIDASTGHISNPYIKTVENDGPVWRVFFGWRGPTPAAADTPVVLRCRIRRGDTALSERWVYSYYPQPLPAPARAG